MLWEGGYDAMIYIKKIDAGDWGTMLREGGYDAMPFLRLVKFDAGEPCSEKWGYDALVSPPHTHQTNTVFKSKGTRNLTNGTIGHGFWFWV